MVNIEYSSDGRFSGIVKVNGVALPIESINIDQFIGDCPRARIQLPTKVEANVDVDELSILLPDGRTVIFSGVEMRVVDDLADDEPKKK